MEVLKPFLQRVAQPVILSFCISWILWNWEIVVALLWYDAKTISATKSATHMEYIKLHANGWKNYGLPLFFALLYLPTRYGVNWLNAFFRTKERDHVLQVKGTGKMSTLRFLELKKSYDDRIAQISKFIDDEAKLQTDLNITITERDELKKELFELKASYNKLNIDLESKNTMYQNAINQILFYEEKSSIESIFGTYQFELYELVADNKERSSITMYTVSKGVATIYMANNVGRIEFTSNNGISAILDIDSFFYNITSDTVLMRFIASKNMDDKKNETQDILNLLNGKHKILIDYSKIINININDNFEVQLVRT